MLELPDGMEDNTIMRQPEHDAIIHTILELLHADIEFLKPAIGENHCEDIYQDIQSKLGIDLRQETNHFDIAAIEDHLGATSRVSFLIKFARALQEVKESYLQCDESLGIDIQAIQQIQALFNDAEKRISKEPALSGRQ